jgi:hypothetical protein
MKFESIWGKVYISFLAKADEKKRAKVPPTPL